MSVGTSVVTITEAGTGNFATQSVTYLVTVGLRLVKPADVTMQVGDPATAYLPTGGNGGTLTYLSSQPTVATVDKTTGKVTPVSIGTAYVKITEAATGSFASQSVLYLVTVAALPSPPQVKDVLLLDGTTYDTSYGFPTTGFKGASFTLETSSGTAGDYNWSSDAPSWVNVDSNGVVAFTALGNGQTVTITGKPKGGVGNDVEFTFTLTSWFTPDVAVHWSDANINCNKVTTAAAGSWSLPTVQELINTSGVGTGRRYLGSLWSEWGDLTKIPNSGVSSRELWTSEANIGSSRSHRTVLMSSGQASALSDGYTGAGTLCRKSL